MTGLRTTDLEIGRFQIRKPIARISSVLAALLLLTHVASAQNMLWHDDAEILQRAARLHLAAGAGAIPVYYSPEFMTRALRYQKALAACKAWYEQQLDLHTDFGLLVLNKADWEKLDKTPYPLPHAFSTAVVLPGRMEDFPAASDMADDVELLAENIAFHEIGHTYSGMFHMPTPAFLAEMYANLFMVAYVRAQRLDMAAAFLSGPPAKLGRQRYSSIEDFEYLDTPRIAGTDAGLKNVAWFQFQLYRLCDVLLRGKTLTGVLSQLKEAFGDPTPRPFRVVSARLEAIHPGLASEMGDLFHPTTLPAANSGCDSKTGNSSSRSSLVVENLSDRPISATVANQSAITVPSNSWTTLDGSSGQRVVTDQGSCFLIKDEPSIARIPAN